MKGNALLSLVLIAVLVLSLAGCTVTKKGDESPPPASVEPTPSASPSANADDLYNDTETKAAIQTAVESLVLDDYKGAGYSCDILTSADGSGYIVSLQVDVGVEPPESTEIISKIADEISGLSDNRIVEIQITALKDMKIVDSI